jgi:hypothetical protein
MSIRISEIIVLIVMILWFKFLGNKKGFNRLETFWLYFVLIFSVFFPKIPKHKRKFVILGLLATRITRAPLMFIAPLPFVMAGGGYGLLKKTVDNVFRYNFDLKFNRDMLPKKPTIFIANYAANHFEYVANTMCSDKMCLVLWIGAKNSVKNLYGEDNLIGIPSKDSYEYTQTQVKLKIKHGYDVFVYVERNYKTRDNCYSVTEFRSGIFNIAKSLGVTITPIVFDHVDHTCGLVGNSTYNIHVDRTRLVENVETEMGDVMKLFKRKLKTYSFK